MSEELVTIIMPVRNERKHICESLDSVLAQDFGTERLEILVVDGMSTDGTRPILLDYAARQPCVRVLDNPRGIVPTAMNIGIREARGAYIVRVDGHTVLPPGYLSLCIDCLRLTGADNVGGTMRALGDSYLASGIAAATSSPFGVGNSQFHYSDREQWVDTVYLGAFRREAFHMAGLYDETLVRNQDYELNYRIRKAGGRIFYTPRIWAHYYTRQSLASLWRQYAQYGEWKARVVGKHPASMRPRHLAAPAFVASLGALCALSLVFPLARDALYLEVAAYVLTSLYFSIREAGRRRKSLVFVLPVIYLVLHVSWGMGFLFGLCRLAVSSAGRAPVRR